MIRLGNHYSVKYLDGVQFNHEEIKPKSGYIKSYSVWNRKDAPIFKGVLNILEDGRSVMNVKYVSYSGVENKYENYFDTNGFEIIHTNNSTKSEYMYWKTVN